MENEIVPLRDRLSKVIDANETEVMTTIERLSDELKGKLQSIGVSSSRDDKIRAFRGYVEGIADLENRLVDRLLMELKEPDDRLVIRAHVDATRSDMARLVEGVINVAERFVIGETEKH